MVCQRNVTGEVRWGRNENIFNAFRSTKCHMWKPTKTMESIERTLDQSNKVDRQMITDIRCYFFDQTICQLQLIVNKYECWFYRIIVEKTQNIKWTCLISATLEYWSVNYRSFCGESRRLTMVIQENGKPTLKTILPNPFNQFPFRQQRKSSQNSFHRQ